MILGDLLDARVTGSDGDRVGFVVDVRFALDGPLDGLLAAPRLHGLLVSPRTGDVVPRVRALGRASTRPARALVRVASPRDVPGPLGGRRLGGARASAAGAGLPPVLARAARHPRPAPVSASRSRGRGVRSDERRQAVVRAVHPPPGWAERNSADDGRCDARGRDLGAAGRPAPDGRRGRVSRRRRTGGRTERGAGHLRDDHPAARPAAHPRGGERRPGRGVRRGGVRRGRRAVPDVDRRRSHRARPRRGPRDALARVGAGDCSGTATPRPQPCPVRFSRVRPSH